MAVADLSITTERLTAVEFSMPWMNLGISIVYIKPRKVTITITIIITVLTIITITIIIITMKAPPSLLSFLEPFSNGVWLSTVVAIIIVALMTYVIGTIMSVEAVVVESTLILRPVQPLRVVQPQLLHHEPE